MGIQKSRSGQSGKCSAVIEKAARTAYLDFHRRLRYGTDTSIEAQIELRKAVIKLLVRRLPELLAAQSQEVFDHAHHALCLDILRVYAPTCPQGYGIAQRWVNQTLMELLALPPGEGLATRSRKFFHVPVDQGWVLKAATARRKEMFRHGLGLKAAPLKRDGPEGYELGWYQPARSLPFPDWDCPAYMEFQRAVRGALAEPILAGLYQDVADWAQKARQETRPHHMHTRTEGRNI